MTIRPDATVTQNDESVEIVTDGEWLLVYGPFMDRGYVEGGGSVADGSFRIVSVEQCDAIIAWAARLRSAIQDAGDTGHGD